MKIPEIQNGSDKPFLIYRSQHGDWHYCEAQNQDGETYEWVEEILESDPLATMFKGSDFYENSYPYVYDKILSERLLAEYDQTKFLKASVSERFALVYFAVEHIDSFSSDVTSYLAQVNRPLDALDEMIPFSLKSSSPDDGYDEDKAQEALKQVERQVAVRLNNLKKEAVAIDNALKDVNNVQSQQASKHAPGKRNFHGYEEISSLYVNRRLIFIGENRGDEELYLVGEYKWDNPFGAMQSVYAGFTGDYIEALDKFSELVENNIRLVIKEREARKGLYGVEPLLLTAADCIPNGLNKKLTGKVIVIKHDVLMREYQRSDFQLKICTGGFGASPDASGSAVFCTDLFTGENSRYERHDILGVADMEKLPKWAKLKLSELIDKTVPPQKTATKPKEKAKKSSLFDQLDEAKVEAAALNAERKNTTVTKKQKGLEVD